MNTPNMNWIKYQNISDWASLSAVFVDKTFDYQFVYYISSNIINFGF